VNDDGLEPERVLLRALYGRDPTDAEVREFEQALRARATPEERAEPEKQEHPRHSDAGATERP
jgi:hypothetical protein